MIGLLVTHLVISLVPLAIENPWNFIIACPALPFGNIVPALN